MITVDSTVLVVCLFIFLILFIAFSLFKGSSPFCFTVKWGKGNGKWQDSCLN